MGVLDGSVGWECWLGVGSGSGEWECGVGSECGIGVWVVVCGLWCVGSEFRSVGCGVGCEVGQYAIGISVQVRYSMA